MSTRQLRPAVENTMPPPPPLPRRITLKLRRIYLDLTGPVADREWRRAWPLIDSVPGYLENGQEKWLFETAFALASPANIVEVGSFKGRSTCSLAFGCRGTDKRVFAVDSFNGNDTDFSARGFFNEFTTNLKRCGLSPYVEPMIGISHEIARAWTKPIHLLFIDGSHTYEDVLADFQGFFPHVVPGGIVALHDVCDSWPGPARLWHEAVEPQLANTGSVYSLAYGRKRATL